MEVFFAATNVDSNLIGTFVLLIGLELILGIDNILVISILTQRLPKEQQSRARVIGLALALLARIAFLYGVTWLLRLTTPISEMFPFLGWLPEPVAELPMKGLILVLGGLFLLYKATKEIYHVIELADEEHLDQSSASFGSVVFQILLLDIVFSLDSVITAVGLTDNLWVIIAAVVLSFVVVLFAANPVSNFILANPALKILALAFLLTIGTTIILEGCGHHIPKGYIYLPMGFALGVQLLQMRYDVNKQKG